MNALHRYEQYKDESLDVIILKIRRGDIKCGKYANLVKLDKDFKIKGKNFFVNKTQKGGFDDECRNSQTEPRQRPKVSGSVGRSAEEEKEGAGR